MAKTVFISGTIVSSSFLNQINNIVCDGQDIDGHRDKIQDFELADDGVKAKIDNFLAPFEVTLGPGDDINISGGSYVDEKNVYTTIGDSVLTITGDGTYYIYINDGPNYQDSIPNLGIIIAKLVISGTSRVITDLRAFFKIEPQVNTIAIFGGKGDTSFRAISSGVDGFVGNEYQAVNPVLNGLYDYVNFTVDPGAVVTIRNGAIINCTNSFTVDPTGIIDVESMVPGGGGFTGTITGYTDLWSNSGKGLGAPDGHNSVAAEPYTAYSSLSGSGGASAYFKTRINAAPTASNLSEVINIECGGGGKGGGYLVVNAVNNILIDGNVIANGSNGGDNVYTGGLVSGQFFLAGGSGGGSGGTIWLRSLKSITLSNGSFLSCIGGDGGNGLISPNEVTIYSGIGGGGGSGGRLILESPNNTTTGSIVNLSGGNAGVNNGTGGSSISGSTGGSYASKGGVSGTNGNPGVLSVLNRIPT